MSTDFTSYFLITNVFWFCANFHAFWMTLDILDIVNKIKTHKQARWNLYSAYVVNKQLECSVSVTEIQNRTRRLPKVKIFCHCIDNQPFQCFVPKPMFVWRSSSPVIKATAAIMYHHRGSLRLQLRHGDNANMAAGFWEISFLSFVDTC